jgi:5S rRNA maturation endonuclease (ribonuclease M5)
MRERKWTAEEKFVIVMEGLKDQKTISENPKYAENIFKPDRLLQVNRPGFSGSFFI